MPKLLEEIHPGEILLEDFMKPMGISARQLAADIDVSPSRISELVNGLRPITADTALRLGLFFGMEPRFWLNLQSEYRSGGGPGAARQARAEDPRLPAVGGVIPGRPDCIPLSVQSGIGASPLQAFPESARDTDSTREGMNAPACFRVGS